MKAKRKYSTPVITRVKLEDKEVITMANGCKTDAGMAGSNANVYLACTQGATPCLALGS